MYLSSRLFLHIVMLLATPISWYCGWWEWYNTKTMMCGTLGKRVLLICVFGVAKSVFNYAS